MQRLLALQRYFDFTGCSGRTEYWQFLGLHLFALGKLCDAGMLTDEKLQMQKGTYLGRL
jgi:uncharacterized membrane protein YhaH (DUF805 family)